MRTHKRSDRRLRPTAEGLETRQLLDAKTTLINGMPINDKDLRRLTVQLTNTYPDGSRIPVSDRRIAYRTPEGRAAVVTLFGKGSLRGSTTTGGVLDLVYDLTDVSTRIVGRVQGHGLAPLAGIRDANSLPRSASTASVNPLNAIVLPDYSLGDGGFVNLTGGVLELDLRSVGAGAELHLLEGAQPPVQGATSSFIVTGGAQIGGVSNPTTVSTTTNANNGPTGIELMIDRVDGGPGAGVPLGNPQVFAVDPGADRLIRFDTVTGEPTLAVDLPGLSSIEPAVGLASVGASQVVLVGDGATVRAFDSVTGAALGAFSAANLAGVGLASVDGIGSTNDRTLLVDAGGAAVPINVAASLSAGVAVPTGSAFVPDRELFLSGGATGLPGSDTLYASAAAHFDTFQPNQFQVGVETLALSPLVGSVSETARTALNGGTPFVPAGPLGGPTADPSAGFGGIEASLARLSGVVNGRNAITLYDPSTLVPVGARTLNYPAPLAGLSESFYPTTQGSTLIEIQGNLKRYVGDTAQGLILNARSAVNLVAINAASDTTVLGRPLNHVAIPIRDNVALISTPRVTTDLEFVAPIVIDPLLPPVGPVRLA